jgi:myosin heavy subunit
MSNNKIWIPDKLNKWIMAELVEELDDNEYMIKTSEGLKKINRNDSKPTNNVNKVESINNLINLVHLHEPAILSVIEQRYFIDKIYTFTGPILIAVNPFKELDIYQDKKIKDYFDNCKKDLDPHVFNISSLAYKNLLLNKKNQSILISGESGAGKTISAKLIMNSLSTISSIKSNNSKIEELILASNPILESFGNAKTIRNDNSSRFGKFIKLFINNTTGVLDNAKIETYLLEKVRVVKQSENERNYHIFYQYLTKSGITTPYNYLNNEFVELDDDLDKQLELDKAFKTLGFETDTVSSIYQLIMGILELGNLEFNNLDNNQYQKIADFLKVKIELLKETLTKKKIYVANEICISDLNQEQFEYKRDAISKEIYGFLFNYIVKRINTKICSEKISNNINFIGILDIFGFEIFEKNDFEQFCINYANETLQNQFNKNIFEYEQNIYHQEGIEWSFIDYLNNQECIDLIHNNKTGIIGCLNEVCRFPIGNDKKFIEILSKENKNNEYLECSNIDRVRNEFKIKHYAGKVNYKIGNFCEKNKDKLNVDCINLLKSSKNIILENYQNKNEKNFSNIKSISLTSQFKKQLKNLLDVISETDLHYIRCLKPNDENKPNNFNNNRMSEQLKYNGVLEAIRVARLGYPIRFSFDDYNKRYDIIKKQIKELKLSKENIQKGKTLFFLKKETYELFEKLRNKKLNLFVIIIQSNIRAYQSYTKFKKIKSATLILQKNIRAYLCYTKFKKIKSAALILQKNFRAYQIYTKFKKIKSAVLILQKNIRTHQIYTKFKKIKNAVLILQKNIRAYQSYTNYKIKQLEANKLKADKLKADKLKQLEADKLKQLEADKLKQLEADKLKQLEADKLKTIRSR